MTNPIGFANITNMKKHYKNSGKMFGQTFHTGLVSDNDNRKTSLMLVDGEKVWKPIPLIELEDARIKYPEAKLFKVFCGFNDKNFYGNAWKPETQK